MTRSAAADLLKEQVALRAAVAEQGRQAVADLRGKIEVVRVAVMNSANEEARLWDSHNAEMAAMEEQERAIAEEHDAELKGLKAENRNVKAELASVHDEIQELKLVIAAAEARQAAQKQRYTPQNTTKQSVVSNGAAAFMKGLRSSVDGGAMRFSLTNDAENVNNGHQASHQGGTGRFISTLNESEMLVYSEPGSLARTTADTDSMDVVLSSRTPTVSVALSADEIALVEPESEVHIFDCSPQSDAMARAVRCSIGGKRSRCSDESDYLVPSERTTVDSSRSSGNSLVAGAAATEQDPAFDATTAAAAETRTGRGPTKARKSLKRGSTRRSRKSVSIVEGPAEGAAKMGDETACTEDSAVHDTPMARRPKFRSDVDLAQTAARRRVQEEYRRQLDEQIQARSGTKSLRGPKFPPRREASGRRSAGKGRDSWFFSSSKSRGGGGAPLRDGDNNVVTRHAYAHRLPVQNVPQPLI